jgi:hypothetical protein
MKYGTRGVIVPDGNEAIRSDIPAVIELVARTALWVNPEVFKRLPPEGHLGLLVEDSM